MSATRPRRYGSIVNIAERCAASFPSNSLRTAKGMRDFIRKPSGPILSMLWGRNRQVERVAILPVHRAVGRLGDPGRVPMLVTLPPQNALPGAVIIERPSPPTLPIGCGLLTSRISRPWRAFSFSPSFSSRATTTRVAGTRRSDISHPPNLIGAWLRPRAPLLEVKSENSPPNRASIRLHTSRVAAKASQAARSDRCNSTPDQGLAAPIRADLRSSSPK